MSTKSKQQPTVISFVLDRSGSMGVCRKETIDGFNEYVNGLQKSKQGKEILFSLTTFDDQSTDKIYDNAPIKKVEKLSARTYEPRGMTPLYDAVVDTVEDMALRVKEDQPALVVIMTDGAENASRKHDRNCLNDLIQKLQKRGNWTFVFLGANQDSWATGGSIGVQMDNITNWNNTGTGTMKAFQGLAMASLNYVDSMSHAKQENKMLSVSNFFNDSSKGEIA